jgi:hypothetical protein
MNNISKEEYLRLLNDLLEEDITDDDFIDSKSETIDLAEVKKDNIKQYLLKSNTFVVYNYLIKIGRNLSNDKITIEIYEEKFRTPSGAPCQMAYKVNLRKDSRFANCPWLNKLDFTGYRLQNTDQDTFIEVVKWLQIVKKLSVFT